MPNELKSLWTPITPPSKEVTPEKTWMDRAIDTVGVIPRVAGMGIRLGSGVLAGEGGLTGAAIAGGGEAVAEGIENLGDIMQGRKPQGFSLPRIGVESTLGLVPLGSIASKGRMAVSAAKGAALAGAGIEGRKWANGEDLTDINKWDVGNMALGAGLGMLGAREPNTPLSISPRSVPEAPPPAAAPRPDITKPGGLRVFTGYDEKGVYTGADKAPVPTLDEHGKLRTALDKEGNEGELHGVLATRFGKPKPTSLEEAHDEANKLTRNEAASDIQAQASAEADKIQNATAFSRGLDKAFKTLDSQLQDVQKAQALRAKEAAKARDINSGIQDATDALHANQDKEIEQAANDLAAQAEIEAAKKRIGGDEGVDTQESVVERQTLKGPGNQTDTVTRRFVPKQPEGGSGSEGGGGGDPSPTGGNPFIIKEGGQTIFRSAEEAIRAEHLTGAAGSIRIGNRKWVHVFREGVTPKVPTEAPAAPEAPTTGAAADDLGDIRAAAEAPIPDTANDIPNGAPTKPTSNVIKTSPMDDINDVNLATGVDKTAQVKVPPTVFKTLIQAQGAARKAGIPETAIQKWGGGGYRIAPQGPIHEVVPGYEAGAIAQPKGVVLENTQGKWNRTEFEPKPEEPINIKQQLEDSLKQGKGEAPPEEPPPASPAPVKPKGPKGPLGEGNKGEAGYVTPEYLGNALLHGGGALVGGAIGSRMDEENHPRGFLAGAALGAGLPALARKAGGLNIDPSNITGMAEKAENVIPAAMRFNLLTDPLSLLINAFAAPAGASTMGSLENLATGALSGNAEQTSNAGKALKGIIPTFFSGPQWSSALDEAAERIGKNERGEILPEDLPNAAKWLGKPAQFMTGGDILGRRVLMDQGNLPESAARAITVTGEARTATGNKIVNFGRMGGDEQGRKALLAKMLLPFSRTAVNVMESGIERAPVLGLFLDFNPEGAVNLYNKVAQQGISAGVAYSSYWLGANLDPDTIKQYRVSKLVSNAAGQYGLIAATAFAAGVASQSGKDPVGAAEGAVFSGLPLPTAQAPQDIFQSLYREATGEDAHPRATHWPQRHLPNVAVPGFARDQFIDEVEEPYNQMIRGSLWTPVK